MRVCGVRPRFPNSSISVNVRVAGAVAMRELPDVALGAKRRRVGSEERLGEVHGHDLTRRRRARSA
jgi:hypothetical protein